jgi:hypothetical protein
MRRLRVEYLKQVASLMAQLLALVASDFSAEAQTLLSSSQNIDDEFRKVGIASDGTVVVLAQSGGGTAVIYEFAGTNVQVYQPDHFSVIEDGEDVRMSRDGEYFAVEYNDGYSRDISLWTRSAPSDLLIITNPVASSSQPRDVISLPDGPMILTDGTPVSMLWHPSTGWYPCASNPITNTVVVLDHASADGKQFVGTHIFSINKLEPVRLKGGKVRHLSTRGANNGAFCISPNGRFIGGMRNLRAAIWYNRTSFYLHAGPSVTEHVTDSGFAIVDDSEGQKVYDPRTRRTYLFNNWWEKYYPTVPLPVPVSRVRDLYEHGGHLYFLISGQVDEFNDTHNIVAIAPLKRPKRYKM